jgi:hypothetical protein
MKNRMKRPVMILAIALCAGHVIGGATPPDLINYQGVLRDASDRPLDGDYDMVFRFYNAETGGDEILIDRHTAGDSEPVTVSGGLFSVPLGAGAIQDGTGLGNYLSLADVFRDYGEVWLRVEVGGEVLDPRVRVIASAYALNSEHLDGNAASFFLDTSATPQTKSGPLTVDASTAASYGVEGHGQSGGGYFTDADGSGYARLGYGAYGVYTGGDEGSYFEDTDNSGRAWIANGNWGVGGYGDAGGGFFEDTNSSGYARVGYGDRGIEAFGNSGGGFFQDADGSGYAVVGSGNYGIEAYGNTSGGFFQDANDSGYSFVGYGGHGIWAAGNTMGGYFIDANESAYAQIAESNWGIKAHGDTGGGFFEDTDQGAFARVGWGGYGIYAEADFTGAEFRDADEGGYVLLGHRYKGVDAWSPIDGSAAGYFHNLGNGLWTGAAGPGYSTAGNGAKDFVQNHPYDRDRVIVYAALEGDEVGTYTRGMARLVNGVARVPLGETFAWVTNPDIGLTAHVTPVGEWSDLYVAEKSTSEIVVRSHGNARDATFDYVIYGLRIGFEEHSVVRDKELESFIPSTEAQRERYERDPELRRFNPLERFKEMVGVVEGTDAVDLERSAALKAAIQVYDPDIHGPVDQLFGHGPNRRSHAPTGGSSQELEKVSVAQIESSVDADASYHPRAPIPGVAVQGMTDFGPWPEKAIVDPSGGAWLPVSTPTEAGQVLVFDPERPGMLRPSIAMADPGVIGVAAGHSTNSGRSAVEAALEVPVVVTGLVECMVDAGFGSIRAGDLLTTSPTPGHAMRAFEALPGTILGKAMEPLDAGTGKIRILVMPR